MHKHAQPKDEAEPNAYAEAKVELGWTGELELISKTRMQKAVCLSIVVG